MIASDKEKLNSAVRTLVLAGMNLNPKDSKDSSYTWLGKYSRLAEIPTGWNPKKVTTVKSELP